MLRGMHPSTAPREVQGHTGTRRDAHNSQPQLRGCRTTRGRGGLAPTHSKELEEPPPLPAGLQAVGGEQRAVLLQEGRAERGSGRRDTPQLSTSALQPGGGQGGAGSCPTVHSRRGAGAACAWTGAGAEVRAEHQSTCVPLPWHRAGAEGTTLGGEAAPLQPPFHNHQERDWQHCSCPTPPHPPSSSKPSSSPCPQNRAASRMASLDPSPAPPCQRDQGGGHGSHSTSRPPPTCR